uniref:Uncharacterized protein n=1 Tax=Picea glauca TaxID=3330 RepID=A0A117NG77_PICGL|nr:hypothetical protein ABT39_MTgene1471 [Picea glauca]QHR90969.1 hypothetical protein Q903MT_gene4998 [Picea sitchensis]
MQHLVVGEIKSKCSVRNGRLFSLIDLMRELGGIGRFFEEDRRFSSGLCLWGCPGHSRTAPDPCQLLFTRLSPLSIQVRTDRSGRESKSTIDIASFDENMLCHLKPMAFIHPCRNQ